MINNTKKKQGYWQKKHLDQQSGLSGGFATIKTYRKRPVKLDLIFDLQNSLSLMRKRWKDSGFYEKQFIEMQAKELKKRINKEIGQYKQYIKKDEDDFIKTAVDCLF